MFDRRFEDGDQTIIALKAAKSQSGLTRGMWSVLEGRRTHWARIISRNALLLHAAGLDDAVGFTAVAAAQEEGRNPKKVPVMKFV